MGCVFSRNKVTAPRIFKRKKVSRSQKYEISTRPEVKDVSTQTTRDHLCPIQSQRKATLNAITTMSGWYTPDVAPSTLLFLAGPKDCLEDSIPELANVRKNKNNKTQESNDNKENKDFDLPACLEYQGFHEHGFHMFTLNSSVFNNTVQEMSLDFGDRLLRVVLYRPSWYFQMALGDQTDNSCSLSSVVREKLRVTSDYKELARLTGFPGEIKEKPQDSY